MTTHQLVWFRSDLRVADNPALHHASKAGTVIAIYLLYADQWQQHGEGDNKCWFRIENLKSLQAQLSTLNIPLIVVQANSFENSASFLSKWLKELQCQGLWFNDEYGVNEEQRDNDVQAQCQALNISCHRYTDQVLFKPGSVLNGKQKYFKVFTPFKKSLYKQLETQHTTTLSIPDKQPPVPIDVSNNVSIEGLYQPTAEKAEKLWKPGEAKAHMLLNTFIAERADEYKATRDVPGQASTSYLSAYLACGVLSARQCFSAALQANDGELDSGSEGLQCWMSELIWREFYRHILQGFPRISKNRAFVVETDHIPWVQNQAHYEAWCNGETGYPIVDAAMKQLVTTGWMHNRLRMVTAMFLTKNLMLDWRLGEAFFMTHLIDGDFASNNGGWQWSASTGTDAAPYFRMFNPINQSEKFDPQGLFIRKYLKRLIHLDNHAIHGPWLKNIKVEGYPDPIIDHKFSRDRVLTTFKALKSG